jgi:hypothetical protein
MMHFSTGSILDAPAEIFVPNHSTGGLIKRARFGFRRNFSRKSAIQPLKGSILLFL